MHRLVRVYALFGQDQVSFTSPWFFTCPDPSRSCLGAKKEALVLVITHHVQWMWDLVEPSTSFLPSPRWAGSLSFPL